jgi:hypothetical protein
LERKLEEHGVKKLVPGDDALASAFLRADYLQRLDSEVAKMRSTLIEEKPFVPDDLRACVEALHERDPSMSWDAAVWNIRAGREHTDEII